ncbi:MAG: TraR/DksA family transcriptional regulator [Bacteriovorax sp.]|nr:TraR/DksA family transcriptional regulator [Bacteriovorax sp.]
MDRKLLGQFENLFLELKKNTLNEMKLEDKSLSWEKGDEVDQSQEERDRAMNLKLLGRHSFMLKKIDGALIKIKNGTFGTCDECDGEIEINRLRARPVATECISCKEEGERTEGQLLYEKRSHTHGKSFGSNVIPLRNFETNMSDLDTNVLAMNSDIY